MRFICCDLENTSWEDDVDPRHFITVRQAPPAVDPKQAPQSLLSLTVHTHRHTRTCLHFHHTITQEGVRECTRPLPLSLYNFHSSPPPPLHTSARNPIWISMESRLFGYPFVDNLPSFWWAAWFFWECFLGVSLIGTRWMSHDSIHIWVRVKPHMSLVPSALR